MAFIALSSLSNLSKCQWPLPMYICGIIKIYPPPILMSKIYKDDTKIIADRAK